MGRSDFVFGRETATDTADLPHAFEEADDSPRCRFCCGEVNNPKHVAYARQELADRERAQTGLQREMGS